MYFNNPCCTAVPLKFVQCTVFENVVFYLVNTNVALYYRTYLRRTLQYIFPHCAVPTHVVLYLPTLYVTLTFRTIYLPTLYCTCPCCTVRVPSNLLILYCIYPCCTVPTHVVLYLPMLYCTYPCCTVPAQVCCLAVLGLYWRFLFFPPVFKPIIKHVEICLNIQFRSTVT